MPEVTRRQVALYAVVALAVAVVGARHLRAQSVEQPLMPPGGRAAGVEVERSPGADGGPVTVHVAGAVRRPGVYRLRSGARVDDAVREAGGAEGDADLAGLNLAAKLEDGRQVVVPERAAAGAAPVAAAGAATPAGAASGAAPAAPVDLNRATLAELDTLDGIGPGLAQRIVEYRDANGGFSSVDELAEVPGIGEKRLAALRERVRV